MKFRALTVLALAAAAVVVPAGAASAQTPVTGPDGLKCGMVTANDPLSPDIQTGFVFGGPVVATEPNGLTAGQLTCTVQVGPQLIAEQHLFTKNDTARVTSGGNVVVARPTPVSFDDDGLVYLCTEFTYSTGETFYWDAVAKAWSTSNEVPCKAATRHDTGTDSSPTDLLRSLICPVVSTVPVVATTLRNLLGCNLPPASDETLVAYVVEQDT